MSTESDMQLVMRQIEWGPSQDEAALTDEMVSPNYRSKVGRESVEGRHGLKESRGSVGSVPPEARSEAKNARARAARS